MTVAATCMVPQSPCHLGRADLSSDPHRHLHFLSWLRHDFVDLPIVESMVSDCGDKVWSQVIHIIR